MDLLGTVVLLLLECRFRSKYPLSRRQIKEYCKEILDCLEYLHGKGIIHRDLKCENIFVQGKSIKIGDLGLATIDGRSVIGTPEFMAPDMYDNNYDASVDIWAFGMCVLEMVTGLAPYHECRSIPQILSKVSKGEKPAALYIVKKVWPECGTFVEKCLGEMIPPNEGERVGIDASAIHIKSPTKPNDGDTNTGESETPDNKAKRINLDMPPEAQYQYRYKRPPASELKTHDFLQQISEEDKRITTVEMMNQAKEEGFDIPPKGQAVIQGVTPPKIAANAFHARQGREHSNLNNGYKPRPTESPLSQFNEGFSDESPETNGFTEENASADVTAASRPRPKADENFTEYIQAPVTAAGPTQNLPSDKTSEQNGIANASSEDVHCSVAGASHVTPEYNGSTGPVTARTNSTVSSLATTDICSSSVEQVCGPHTKIESPLSASRKLNIQRVQTGHDVIQPETRPSHSDLSVRTHTIEECIRNPNSASANAMTAQRRTQPQRLAEEMRTLKQSVSELREMMTFVLKTTEGGKEFLQDLEQRRRTANRPGSSQNAEHRVQSSEHPWRSCEQNDSPSEGASSTGGHVSAAIEDPREKATSLAPYESALCKSEVAVPSSLPPPTSSINIEDYPFLNNQGSDQKQEDDLKQLTQCLHSATVGELDSHFGKEGTIKLPAAFYKEIQRVRTQLANAILSEYRIAARRKMDLSKEVEDMEKRHHEEVEKELRTHNKEKEKFDRSRRAMKRKDDLRVKENGQDSPTGEIEQANWEFKPIHSEKEQYGNQTPSSLPSSESPAIQQESKNLSAKEIKEARERRERKEKTREEANKREKRLLEQREKEEEDRHAEENRKREEDRKRQLKHFAERARKIDEKRAQKVNLFMEEGQQEVRRIVRTQVNSSSNPSSAAEQHNENTMEHAQRLRVATGVEDHPNQALGPEAAPQLEISLLDHQEG